METATSWIQAYSSVDRDEPVRSRGTGHGPGLIAVAHDGLWVANRHSGTVGRLDPQTLELSGTLRIRKSPVAIAAGHDAVWVLGSNGWLWRIWPDAQRAEGVARLGRRTISITVAGDLIWALRRSGRLFGLEPASGEVAIEGKIPGGARHIVARSGALWASCDRGRRLVLFNPETGKCDGDVQLNQPVRCLAILGGALHAGCGRMRSPKRGWLHTIDCSTERLASTIELPGQPRAMVCGLDKVWVACGNGLSREGTIERIDIASGQTTTWRTTDWIVSSLALSDDTLFASMSLELAMPVFGGQGILGGGGGS
jgi:streptogramin lyase